MEELKEAFELHGTMNVEVFYWWCIAIMFAIHAGFLVLEVGISRVKNVLASAMKNLLTLAVIIPSFFFVGWWIYNAFPDGFVPRTDSLALGALPWSANMGPNMADHASGVFWGAFALFAATTASILSGSIIERVRMSAFLILATVLGSAVWILGAAWGWHGSGWMLTRLGYHDTAASGVVHTIAGFFALGVLINLGPRIGKYDGSGKPLPIPGHNMPNVFLGLMLIFFGFFGFLGGCAIFMVGSDWITIYGTPMTLSAFAFNALMGFAGGIIGAYLTSKSDPLWTISGGLAGFISVGAGLDLYYPGLAFIIGAIGGMIGPMIGSWLEQNKIDDPVGAVTVHGFVGVWGVLAVGLFASGYPNVAGPQISMLGQLVGAAVMIALGFVPGYGVSWILKQMNALRIPPEIERLGLDIVEIPGSAYPEGIPPTPESGPSYQGSPALRPETAGN
ncbi:ammonium transporter [Paenibacillus alkalitolerans]|uniref:ammonium transporter n=1 Tax=Paenibacillus alkalitolerans TaxID=2799335 RepID=UPI0018F69CCE|nr:ammonium transporter [Paenibacillus alkalitolerans]